MSQITEYPTLQELRIKGGNQPASIHIYSMIHDACHNLIKISICFRSECKARSKKLQACLRPESANRSPECYRDKDSVSSASRSRNIFAVCCGIYCCLSSNYGMKKTNQRKRAAYYTFADADGKRSEDHQNDDLQSYYRQCRLAYRV